MGFGLNVELAPREMLGFDALVLPHLHGYAIRHTAQQLPQLSPELAAPLLVIGDAARLPAKFGGKLGFGVFEMFY